jgi:urea carboxylase-associated protein 1
MSDTGGAGGVVILDEIVPAGRPWGHVVRGGEILRLVDLEGQQAVDFLCFDAADRGDRYSATNTIKVQSNIYIGVDTVLYSDRGTALFTIITDTWGRHDTIYGCCSEANNLLRYGVRGTPSCYANFREILAGFGLDERSIVGNVNFFMSVPVLPDGSAGIANGISQPGSYVEVRAERNVLAVLSNCPQMHNPCNGYNPTPIRAMIYQPSPAPESA